MLFSPLWFIIIPKYRIKVTAGNLYFIVNTVQQHTVFSICTPIKPSGLQWLLDSRGHCGVALPEKNTGVFCLLCLIKNVCPFWNLQASAVFQLNELHLAFNALGGTLHNNLCQQSKTFNAKAGSTFSVLAKTNMLCYS